MRVHNHRLIACAALVSAGMIASASCVAANTDKATPAPEYSYPAGSMGYGMGPGMMGGWGGGYGMGPGMMGGHGGGYGMGPGMMGGWGGGYGMGPGMMGGHGGYNWWNLDELDLTEQQIAKIKKIQDDTRRAHWALMGTMMDQQAKLRDLSSAQEIDHEAIREAYKEVGALQQKMFEASLDARKRIDAVLTKEQKDKLHRSSRRNW